MFTVALLVTTGFVALTDQGKRDAAEFHEKHIRKHYRDHHKDKGGGSTTKKIHNNKNHIHPHQDRTHTYHGSTMHHQKKTHEQHADTHRKTAHAVEGGDDFPELKLEEFAPWLHIYRQKLDWGSTPLSSQKRRLSKNVLNKSLEMGCMNLVHNQRQDQGNFIYQYDFVHHHEPKSNTDSQVRQAGALWGTALCFQHLPGNVALQKVVEKALDFFLQHSKSVPAFGEVLADSSIEPLVIHYPGDELAETGTNALVALALLEYLRTMKDNHHIVAGVPESRLDTLQEQLQRILVFLQSLQKRETHHFAKSYDVKHKQPHHDSSPYFDGEVLLCLTKAAKYMDQYMTDEQHKVGNAKLLSLVQETAPSLFKAYTLDAWRHGLHDSDETKGFSQWSSMAAAEYYTASTAKHINEKQAWAKDQEFYEDYAFTISHWIVHTHQILKRTKNTGYAMEGLLAAHEVAKERLYHYKDHSVQGVMDTLADAIDTGLHKLTAWQVAGPLAHENLYLKRQDEQHKTIPNDLQAKGGIMSAENDPLLRIDTTQHQMHAVMMALNSDIYTGAENAATSR